MVVISLRTKAHMIHKADDCGLSELQLPDMFAQEFQIIIILFSLSVKVLAKNGI